MPPKKAPAAAKKQQQKVAAASVSTEEVAPVAAGSKKKVSFDAPAVVKAARVPAGIVVPAKKVVKAPVKRERPSQPVKQRKSSTKGKTSDHDGESSDSEADDDSSDEDDDLSLLADASSSDDEEDDVRKKPRKEGGISYRVLRLRFLPTAFQEPELAKFLGQFGARVTNCFCVRSKRTKESKGTAYVQFDNEAVLPIVLEECNGMALGGRTIRARIHEMHRAMPTKPNIRTRRLQGARHQAHGPKLTQHNVSGKSVVAQLVKAARAERKNNEALKAMGIDFSSSAFADQLSRVPKELMLTKAARKTERDNKKAASDEAKKAPGVKKTVQPKKAAVPVASAPADGIVVPAKAAAAKKSKK